MTNFVFVNNASTTLAAAATSSSTTLTLASSTNFPSSIPSGFVLPLTLNDAATRQIYEIVYVMAITGTSLTVTRGQEGTTAQNWSIGDYAFVGLTAGVETACGYGNGQTYANDTGTANAYACTLVPALATAVVGLPIRVKIGNTNTGGSTFNPGPGVVSIVHSDGSGLNPNDLLAGQVATFVYDGTHYQLASPAYNNSQSTGNGYVNKFRNATALVASRGTSGTVSSSTSGYTLDGHYISATGAAIAWSQVTGGGYGPKALQLNCATGLTDAKWAQPIEGSAAAPLAGRTVTFQCRIANNSGGAITPSLTVKHLNASDSGVSGPWTGGSPAANTTDINGQALQSCANNTTTTISWVWTANSSFGNGAFVQLDFGGGLNASSGNVQIGDFDIRLTPNVTTGAANPNPAIPEMRAITSEQLQCQRYLPAFTNTGGSSGNEVTVLPGGAYGSTSTSGDVVGAFPVPTRVAVTGGIVSSVSHFVIQYGGGWPTISGLTFQTGGTTGVNFTFTGASAGAAYAATWLAAVNASASIICTGAEL
jgi:hypothetical protein